MKQFDFNSNWRFCEAGGAFKAISVPHDAMILEKRNSESPGGSAVGFFSPGFYVYEKTFIIPEDWADKYVAFYFEGVYKDSKVYINGKEAGGYSYGYIPFLVPTDGLLHYGTENTIRVEVDNKDMPNSRWYSGAGIYRPVQLLLGLKSHIDFEGIKITTVSYHPARIRIETTHTGGDEVTVNILYEGQVVASSFGDSIELEIPNAKLWSDETPSLYTCDVKLLENGTEVDEVTECFGIRVVEWGPNGLFVNGRETLLRGGCVHHDNGILGARSYTKSEERRVRILKEAGFNAIRSAHNPASTAMLEACDKYGMYVIDETWDMWYNHKSKYDYASFFEANYRSDIETMVSRDFNHPSVIMYSIGNEVSEPAIQKGIDLTREMVEMIHTLDSNRAVTAGMNLMIIKSSAKGKGIYKEDGGRNSGTKDMSNMSSTMFNMITSIVGTSINKAANSKKADEITSPCLNALDIAGYNYASGRYPLEGKAHPNRVIYGSETYPQDIAKNWAMVKKYPYLVGDFMWTAWDYLGENGLGAWSYTPDGKGFEKPYPWLLADTGALDILGEPNGEMFLAQAVWGLLDKPVIAVRPVNHPGVRPAKMVWRGTNAIASWAWKGCLNNKAIIEVYTTFPLVKLLQNGRSLGKKKVKNCKAVFKTRYVPGILTAVAYDHSNREVNHTELVSATGKTRIRIVPEENAVSVGEIVYVDVSLVGENGVIESNDDRQLNVAIKGGELLAFGSATPRTEESYNNGSFTTYFGKALAVVRCPEAGNVTLHVSSPALDSVSAQIKVLNSKNIDNYQI